jgi:hypothetical protein
MAQIECPNCHSTNTLPVPWAVARRYGIAVFVCFWVGLIAMFALTLIAFRIGGGVWVGGVVWLGVTLAPAAVFLVRHWRRRHDRTYRRSRECLHCGHQWWPGTSRTSVSVRDVTRAQVTDERLRWLQQQRQSPPPAAPPPLGASTTRAR